MPILRFISSLEIDFPLSVVILPLTVVPKKISRKLKTKFSARIRDLFVLLVDDIEGKGSEQRDWMNYSKLGVSKQVVSNLENNHRSVSIKRAKVLGDIFKRDYAKFLRNLLTKPEESATDKTLICLL